MIVKPYYNMDKVDWCNFSGNINAIHILEQYIDKIDWVELSSNKNAIDIIINN